MAGRNISILEIRPKEICRYEWDFKIPSKTSIFDNMSKCGDNGFYLWDLKFKTGVLSNVEHSLHFSLEPSEIAVAFKLAKATTEMSSVIESAEIQLLEHQKVNYTGSIVFTDSLANYRSTGYWESKISNSDLPWTNVIDTIRICLTIGHETVGTWTEEESSTSINRISEILPGEFNPAPFYLSSQLSDLKILCGDHEFFVHRIILACLSSVFAAMFEHKMQERENGILQIDDIEPNIVQEMLRYMYTGKVENIHEVAQQLLITAEKYNLGGLKFLCEGQLVQQVTTENALDMYEFSDIFRSNLIRDKAVQIVKRNKATVVPDSSKFKEFCYKYPDLMFDLFKLSN